MGKCPGQDQRYWNPSDIFDLDCPNCGSPIEFWKDDAKLRCPKCEKVISNPKLELGCAKWCSQAKECLSRISGLDNSILCNRLIDDMKNIFGDDKKRIDHALAVLRYATQIQFARGGDPMIVKAAAILHDIGIHQAEKKHGSSAGKYQEIEGPPIARQILLKHGIEDEMLDHICKIIANHHSARDIDTTEFRIVWDADWLVNFPEEYPDFDEQKTRTMIYKIFKTDQGRKMALELFIDTE